VYKLFYYPRNASWAPHLILKELGVDYQLELVDRKSEAQKSAEYLALNPTGLIPTLVDGDKVLLESAAIGFYLCEKHSETNLLPPIGHPLRQSCFQWMFFLTSTIQSELMIYFYPEKHTTDSKHSNSIITAQEDLIGKGLSLLDQQIAEQNYLVGNQITICDYFLFMMCHWASEIHRPPLHFKNLARVMRSLARRESFKEVCEVEGTSLAIYD
jgi:glutathione S-transferase